MVFIFIYIINKISILKATTTTLITINDYDSIFQPELKQPDPSILILEAHIHANPKPKVTWLCNGDFIKESERKHSKLEPRIGEKNKWTAILTIIVSWGYIYLYDFRVRHLCSMRFWNRCTKTFKERYRDWSCSNNLPSTGTKYWQHQLNCFSKSLKVIKR